MYVEQEPKYDVDENGHIYNRVSGEIIPDDEPVMIFRAKDIYVVRMIEFYMGLCKDKTHQAIVEERLFDFVKFSLKYSERMKEPDTEKRFDT